MARIEDVDDAELDRALRFIRDHSSPLFLDGELAGSGTFISWDDRFGILTAHHVPHNPRESAKRFDFSANSSQKLGLSLVEHAHRFELEMHHLRVSDVAAPVDPTDPGLGPDVAVIHLGSRALIDGIAARKLFYRISHQTEERLSASMRDDGIFAICGAAKEEERQTGPELGFAEVAMQSLTTYYGGLGRRFEGDGYHYVEIAVHYSGVDDPPGSFGGVSGGGLWRIPVDSDPADSARYIVSDPVLAGVAYWQTEVVSNLRYLRSHAADAVYQHVLTALRNESSGP